MAESVAVGMSEMVQTKTFHSDVCITSQDEDMKAFYVILYGAAEAYRNGSVAASATVIADDKSIAAEFSRSAIEALLLALFKKLNGANEKIERLMLA